jgi:hypothetical protein
MASPARTPEKCPFRAASCPHNCELPSDDVAWYVSVIGVVTDLAKLRPREPSSAGCVDEPANQGHSCDNIGLSSPRPHFDSSVQ